MQNRYKMVYCFAMTKHQDGKDVATKIKNGEGLSVAEVAAYFGVQPMTVRHWIHTGKLRALKYGKKFTIRPEDLLVVEQRAQSQPPTAAAPIKSIPTGPVSLIYPEGSYEGRGWGDDVA